MTEEISPTRGITELVRRGENPSDELPVIFLFYVILFYFILFYFMLFYVILFYFILFYFILFYWKISLSS
jgi:hypothetical protein